MMKKIILASFISMLFFGLNINAAEALKAPKKVKVKLEQTRSAKLTWKNVYRSDSSKQPDYYKIRVNCNGKKKYTTKHKKKLGKKKNGAYLHYLVANKTCEAKIRTVRGGEKSDWKSVEFDTIKRVSGIKNIKIKDMHVHLDPDNGSLSEFKAYMKENKIKRTVLMSTPTALVGLDESGVDEDYTTFINGSNKFRHIAGGDTLNPLLHALGGAELTEENVFPNGVTESQDEVLAATQALADDPEGTAATFQSLATSIAESGLYPGFGELAPGHISNRVNHPTIQYPANQEQMLWLSDLAAANDMYINIHVEGRDLSEIDELCAHNRNTTIVFSHIGWLEEGENTAADFSDLLANNDNLYMVIKQRDSHEYGDYYPLKKNGKIRSDWKAFLKLYKKRIMVETDSKYWSSETLKEAYEDNLEPLFELLDQLPKSVAKQIAYKTTESLFGF